MFKKTIIALSILLATVGISMGQLNVSMSSPIQFNNVSIISTNQSVGTISMQAGHIDALEIGITNLDINATNSVTILVQLQNSIGLNRTVYSSTGLSSSTIVYPVVTQQNTIGVGTNTNIRIPTYGDQLVVTAYNAGGSTNTVVKTQCIVSNP